MGIGSDVRSIQSTSQLGSSWAWGLSLWWEREEEEVKRRDMDL